MASSPPRSTLESKTILPEHVETSNAKDDVSCITINTTQTMDTIVAKNLGLGGIFRPRIKERIIDDDGDVDSILMEGLTRKAVDDVLNAAMGIVTPSRKDAFPKKESPKKIPFVDSYFPDEMFSQDSASLPLSAHSESVPPFPQKDALGPRAPRFSFDSMEEERQKREASPRHVLDPEEDDGGHATEARLDSCLALNSFYFNSDSQSETARLRICRIGAILLTICAVTGLITFLSVRFPKGGTAATASVEERVVPIGLQPSISPTFDPSIWPTSYHSSRPTKQPTSHPVVSPSFTPTSPPTNGLTKLPTIRPTTVSSTLEPTNRPTKVTSTSEPTNRPNTPSPTLSPSQSSLSPSRFPTSAAPSNLIDFYDWIMLNSPESADALSIQTSPQYLAFLSLKEKRDIEAFALLTLHFMTNVKGWKTSWDSLQTDKCSWYGVDCTSGGNVRGIFLSFNGLDGSLPNEMTLLTHLENLSIAGSAEGMEVQGNIKGKIPSSWGQRLTNLRSLELYDNKLTGSIPTTFSKMTKLDSMDLSGNSLSGSIGSQIGDLLLLRSLDLSSNKFEGNVPTGIGLLTKLQYLSLKDNALLGTIPVNFKYLTDMRELYLSKNDLDGDIGVIRSMKNLEWVALHDNQFIGGLAATVSLTNLVGVQLHNNRMQEAMPVHWGDLKNLRFLDLSSNDFSGTIPKSVQDLHQLVHLALDHNHLTGQVPDGICDLTGLLRLSSDCGTDVQCNCCTECHF